MKGIVLFCLLYGLFFNQFVFGQNHSIKSIEIDQRLEKALSSKWLDEAGLREGAAFQQTERISWIKKIQAHLYGQGYLYGQISAIREKLSADSQNVALRIEGVSGQLSRIGRIRIVADSLRPRSYEHLQSISKGDVYSQHRIESDIKNMLTLAADSGFIFARAEVDPPNIHSNRDAGEINLMLHIHEGAPVKISKIILRGNNQTKDRVILRELSFGIGQRFSRKFMEEIPRELLRTGLFKDVKRPVIARIDSMKYAMILSIKEGNATSFDGVVGYIPQRGKSENGYFTGLLDIAFNNLFGTGRKFNVHWEKPDVLSENFVLNYTEPWVANYPLDLSTNLERTVRDSTYLEWKASLHARYRFGRVLSAIAQIGQQVVLPDSFSSIRLHLARYKQINYQVGIVYDNRDYPLNPRQGIFFSNSYTFANKTNFGPGFLLRQDSIAKSESIEILKLRFDWYYELLKNQVTAIKLTANQVKGDRLQLTDYIWFGGARSVRGYRENQFQGSVAAWVNLEYRFLIGRNSRLFLFNDWGIYRYRAADGKDAQEIPMGYGLGFRVDTALGNLGVAFGLGRGDSFSEAKIHFGIENRF